MKKFRKALRGYNVKEVNAFISEVICQVEKMIAEDNRKTTIINNLNKELQNYKNMEEALKKSIVMAEETASQMKKMARIESESIINDAKKNANKIVSDALVRAQKIEAESAILKKNISIFKTRLKNIIEQQLQIVDDIEDYKI